MTARSKLRIVHLLDAPEAAPTLARWFVDDWTPWYGPDGPGDATADLAACGSRDALPICLVALGAAGEVVGTAALKSESLGSELGIGSWLAALLVGSNHRGQGIGTALVTAIEAEARRLGFASIYTSTTLSIACSSVADGKPSDRPSRSGARSRSIDASFGKQRHNGS